MTIADLTTSTCGSCQTENDPDARFCKKCGTRLHDNFIDPEMEQRLYERIEAKLNSQWLAKDVVEKDMALNAATKIFEWAKLFAMIMSIPIAIAIAIFAFVGIKTTMDLSDIETRTQGLKKTEIDLEAAYKPIRDRLPALNSIVDSINGLSGRVSAVESQVARFAPSSSIDQLEKNVLLSSLSGYASYLRKLGLPPRQIPVIHVQDPLPLPGYDAYLQGGDIFVKPTHAIPAKVDHEYSHSVLMSPIPPELRDGQWAYSALEAGVANYLTADFLNSPIVDTVDLTQRTPMSGIGHTFVGGQGEGGVAWGSYMWALREHYTSVKATPAIVRAYRSLRPTNPPQDYQRAFLDELVKAGLDRKTVNDLRVE